MPILTMIARVSDGLQLAASVMNTDDGLAEHQQQAKKLLKKLGNQSPNECSIESGEYVFHYLISGGVCFLTLADKGYPREMAFAFLDELRREFMTQYGDQIDKAARPYAFVKFDVFIQKTKKVFSDSRMVRNSKYDRLNSELQDVHRIMSTNIQDVLGRGEKLEAVSDMSARLSLESRKYVSQTKTLNAQALLRKWGPVVVVLGVVAVVFYMRW